MSLGGRPFDRPSSRAGTTTVLFGNGRLLSGQKALQEKFFSGVAHKTGHSAGRPGFTAVTLETPPRLRL